MGGGSFCTFGSGMLALTSKRIDKGGAIGWFSGSRWPLSVVPLGWQRAQWGFLYVNPSLVEKSIEYNEHSSLTMDNAGSLFWFEAHAASCNTQSLYCCFAFLGAYFHEQSGWSFKNFFTVVMLTGAGIDSLVFVQDTWRPQKDKFPALLHLAQAMLLYVTFCVQSKTGSSLSSAIYSLCTARQLFVPWRLCKPQVDFMITPDHGRAGSTSPHIMFPNDASLPGSLQLRKHNPS